MFCCPGHHEGGSGEVVQVEQRQLHQSGPGPTPIMVKEEEEPAPALAPEPEEPEEPEPAAPAAPEPPAPEPAPPAEEPKTKVEPPVAEPAKPVEVPTAPAKDPFVEEFEIKLTKKDKADSLGLHILDGRGCFVVTGCKEGGMIDRWNKANPDRVVKYGTVVYSVNGVTSSLKAMMESCVAHTDLTLKARRHNRYTVVVDKKKILGLDVHPESMTVRKLTQASGPNKTEDITLHSWNNSCTEGMEIMVNDRVVEVNGFQGTPAELLQQIRACTGRLTLVFERM